MNQTVDKYVFETPESIIGDIDTVQFSLLSSEEIIREAVCKIDNTKMFGAGSVYDPLMGPMNIKEICPSCSLTSVDCPGHYGMCELACFILHPLFHRTIVNILKCVCISCYRVVLTEDHLLLEGVQKSVGDIRFKKVVEKLDKVSLCYHCSSPKPKVIYAQATNDIYIKFEKTKLLLTDLDIKKIFDNMIEEDIKILGFNPKFFHPKNLVLSHIRVIPPRARPYVISEGITCDDDITLLLIDIIKQNQIINDPNALEIKREKAVQNLKFKVKTIMSNTNNKAKHSNGRPMKGIKERISGKTGLIRQNLMGYWKYTARNGVWSVVLKKIEFIFKKRLIYIKKKMSKEIKNRGIIYRIVNKVNGNSYIGKTKEFYGSGTKYGLEGRWKKHIYDSTKSLIFSKAIRKYGEDNFAPEILLYCELDKVDEFEILMISTYDTTNPKFGYNIAKGGLGRSVVNVSEDIREKISNSQKKEDQVMNLREVYKDDKLVGYRIWRREQGKQEGKLFVNHTISNCT